MNGASLVLRGLRDTYEHLIYFTLVTLLWWVCFFLIPISPGGTIALFKHTDPRIGTLTERPNWSETLRLIQSNLWRGWRVSLLTGPLLLLILFNIGFYSDRVNGFRILVPLWVCILVITLLVRMTAYSIAAMTDEERARSIGRLAFLVIGAKLPQALLMLLLMVVVAVLFSMLVVPAIMFGPAFIAAVINRFTLTALRLDIPDSTIPTPELLAEGPKKRKWFGP